MVVSEGITLSSSHAIVCCLVLVSWSRLVFIESHTPFPLAQIGNLELFTCKAKNMSRERESDDSFSG